MVTGIDMDDVTGIQIIGCQQSPKAEHRRFGQLAAVAIVACGCRPIALFDHGIVYVVMRPRIRDHERHIRGVTHTFGLNPDQVLLVQGDVFGNSPGKDTLGDFVGCNRNYRLQGIGIKQVNINGQSRYVEALSEHLGVRQRSIEDRHLVNDTVERREGRTGFNGPADEQCSIVGKRVIGLQRRRRGHALTIDKYCHLARVAVDHPRYVIPEARLNQLRFCLDVLLAGGCAIVGV